jgi:L-threonylcarbamoyladenylate synthase
MSGNVATRVLGADEAGTAEAAAILQRGGLVAVPTETVYGLAGLASDAAAIARIFHAKGRPVENPLIVHVGSIEEADRLVDWPAGSREVAERLWPGPLTLVLPKRPGAHLAAAVTAGLSTVAVRVPSHRLMLQLARECGPLAAPSANRSGRVSPTNAEHVKAALKGRIDAILDGGSCAWGVESTILSPGADGNWRQLRAGPIDLEQVRAVTGQAISRDESREAQSLEAPGQLKRHYAPGKPMKLNALGPEPDQFMIGFGAIGGDCTLSTCGSLEEAAARLYECLHLAARASQPRIAVASVPDEGLGVAINDRLRRAAA